jgi:hypothetical protein
MTSRAAPAERCAGCDAGTMHHASPGSEMTTEGDVTSSAVGWGSPANTPGSGLAATAEAEFVL